MRIVALLLALSLSGCLFRSGGNPTPTCRPTNDAIGGGGGSGPSGPHRCEVR